MAVAKLEDAEVPGDVVERLAVATARRAGPSAPGGTGPGRAQPRKGGQICRSDIARLRLRLLVADQSSSWASRAPGRRPSANGWPADLGWRVPRRRRLSLGRPTRPRCTPGIPLTDEDRWPWLAAMHDRAGERDLPTSRRRACVACSALRAGVPRRRLGQRPAGCAAASLLDGDRPCWRAGLASSASWPLHEPGALESQIDDAGASCPTPVTSMSTMTIGAPGYCRPRAARLRDLSAQASLR